MSLPYYPTLNEQPLTLEDLEVWNYCSVGMWVSDWQLSTRRHIWVNETGIRMLRESSREDFLAADLVAGTSSKMNQMNDVLYKNVQVEGRNFWDKSITLYPGGEPRHMRFNCVPIRIQLPGKKEPEVLCLTRAEVVSISDEDEGRRLRSHEILGHMEIVLLLFTADGKTLLQSNTRVNECYPQASEMGTSMQLLDVLDSCVWESEMQRNALISQLSDLKSMTEIEKMKKFVDSEGRQCWHRISFIPCLDPVTGHPVILVIESDLTSLKLVQLELVDAQKSRQSFFTAITHELRTPLNGIIGLADTIGHEKGTPQHIAEALKVIKANGSRLNHLISDILDESDLKTNDFEMRMEEVCLAEIVQQVVEIMEPLARKAVPIQNCVPPNLPIIDGDSDRIIQCIINLIGNAQRFTTKGYIRVTAEQQGADHVVIHVADTGSGIPPNKLATIFIGPRQINTEHAKVVGNAGLGLPLVKKIVELLGGTIGVVSEPNVQTVFSIVLPLRQPGKKEPTAKLEGGAGGGCRGQECGGHCPAASMAVMKLSKYEKRIEELESALEQLEQTEKRSALKSNGSSVSSRTMPLHADKGLGRYLGELVVPAAKLGSHVPPVSDHSRQISVLCVDDNAINMMVIRGFLEAEGYRVVEADSGADALRIMNSDERPLPDMCLLDVEMPGMSGYDVCSELRATFSAEEFPIILLSSNRVEDIMQKGLDVGCNDCLPKPFSRVELFHRIRQSLQLKSMHAALTDQEQIKSKTWGSPPISSCVTSTMSSRRSSWRKSMSSSSRSFMSAIEASRQLSTFGSIKSTQGAVGQAGGPYSCVAEVAVNELDESMRGVSSVQNAVYESSEGSHRDSSSGSAMTRGTREMDQQLKDALMACAALTTEKEKAKLALKVDARKAQRQIVRLEEMLKQMDAAVSAAGKRRAVLEEEVREERERCVKLEGELERARQHMSRLDVKRGFAERDAKLWFKAGKVGAVR